MSADSFDMVPTGTDLTPISPSVPTLSPAESWGAVDQDYFGTQDQQYRGQSLPDGVSQQQFNQFMGEISGLFMGDMARLGCSNDFTQTAISWYRNAITGPVPNEPVRHKFNFSGISVSREDQPWVTAFANHMTGHSQDAVRAAVWWMGELAKKLNQQQQTQSRSLDDLSDAEYAKLERKYADDAQKAEAILRREWGHSYSSNLAIADRFLHNMPANQRHQIETDVIRGVSALNSPDVVMWLFQQAVGVSANISGAGLAKRIAEIEHLIKVDRKAYNDSPEIQSELRELYRLRG